MGRSYTPKFIVVTTENTGQIQQMEWKGGAPTEKKLQAWLDVYNASFQPGGVNFPISQARGFVVFASKAVIRRNQTCGEVLVTFNMPLFSVA